MIVSRLQQLYTRNALQPYRRKAILSPFQATCIAAKRNR